VDADQALVAGDGVVLVDAVERAAIAHIMLRSGSNIQPADSILRMNACMHWRHVCMHDRFYGCIMWACVPLHAHTRDGDGWMHVYGCIDGCMHACMRVRIDGCIDAWMHVRTHRWMYRCMHACVDA
jgi:hypothetical protein